jgi:membrane-bound metal-dependent hydrolase YbcI (DUF457 family)
MFIGHYGVSFAVKSADKSPPLWVLFLAAQLVDIFWAVLVLMNHERARITPGLMAASPLDLYYMPYTHSLPSAFVWAGAAALGYWLPQRLVNLDGSAWLVGLTVLSHWFLDFIAHRPDMPLYGNYYKVGLGLWNFIPATLVVEGGLLLGGVFLYLRAQQGRRAGFVLLAFALLAVQLANLFGPPPPSSRAVALTGLCAYLILAAVVYWLERKQAA